MLKYFVLKLSAFSNLFQISIIKQTQNWMLWSWFRHRSTLPATL